MPQLDFSTYASQIFWLFLTFALLYITMARLALPRVRDVLETRQSRIAQDIADAEKRKEEAELAKADFASALHDAKQRAHSILQASYQEIAHNAKQAHAVLNERFELQEKEAQQRQLALRTEATTQMNAVSAELAQYMLKRLINTSFDLQAISRTSQNITQ